MGVKQLIAGIKGSKPGSGPPKPDGSLSKQQSHALDAEYRRQRNQSLQLKNHREAMLLAKARGELIEKRLVALQASFLLVAMRQRALALPQAYCDRLAAVSDPVEAKAILDETVFGFLDEVADLPRCVDAGEWQKFLDEQSDNGAPSEPEERPAKARPPRRRPK